MTRKEMILATVSDLVTDFLYYDRKGDSCLPVDSIEEAIASAEITADEIVDAFLAHLQASLE